MLVESQNGDLVTENTPSQNHNQNQKLTYHRVIELTKHRPTHAQFFVPVHKNNKHDSQKLTRSIQPK